MFDAPVWEKIEQELARGAQARQNGFEGRARVSARRAAGIAARAYLTGRGLPLPGPSAIDLLEALRTLPDLEDEARENIERLLLRVEEDFSLPVQADLLEDARQLAQQLEQALEK